VDISDLTIIADQLPPRARRLVTEWGRTHRSELRENWTGLGAQPLQQIEPL